MTDPFKRLGLNRMTATEADVKTAYAALLKKTRPEDDRAAFMELRDAFTNARAVARRSDTNRANVPEPAQHDPLPTAQEPVKWSYDKDLAWNFANNAFGKLAQSTIRWMVDGGKDPNTFLASVAERLLTETTVDEAHFRREIISYIIAKADLDQEREVVPQWEVFDLDAPDWLSKHTMAALAHELRLFKDKPQQSWDARDYNLALRIFDPVLGDDNLQDLDVARLFADEQNEGRKDDHGSYFDRGEMAWKDMSPVGIAMRDITAAVEKPLWDLPDVIAAVLQREDVQAIDEFQQLDTRLRHLICDKTGFHGDPRDLSYPKWLSPRLILLLDDTFGWSRHHGRRGWEQQQLNWLHKVIARDRKPDNSQVVFKAAAPFRQPAPAQAQPAKANPFAEFMLFLLGQPLWILALYLGYRALQTFYRFLT